MTTRQIHKPLDRKDSIRELPLMSLPKSPIADLVQKYPMRTYVSLALFSALLPCVLTSRVKVGGETHRPHMLLLSH
jgi:hypothetical protein